MKYLMIFVVLAVLIGGGAWYILSRVRTAEANANVLPPTEKVMRRDIERSISANGMVASNRDVEIKCQASGQVTDLPFDVSDKVKVGDLLMKLDPIDQQRLVDQAQAQVDASNARSAQAEVAYEVAKLNVVTSRQRAEADLASSKAKAADAKAKENRVQELFTSQLASAEELETAKTTTAQADANVMTAEAALAEVDQQEETLKSKEQDIKSAKAQLAQDNFKLDTQKRQLEYTKVYVPSDDASKTADYRVSSLTVQPGTVVQSGSSGINGGTTVMKLADVSHMFVLAEVDESDIGQVSDPAYGGEPQHAKVTVEAQKNMEFDGVVVRVATTGVTTSNVTTFEVKVEVTDPKRFMLKPAMTATAKIIVAERPHVLSIPVAAFKPAEPGDSSDASAPDAPSPSAASSTGPATTRRGGGRGRGARRPAATATAPSPGTPIEGTAEVVTAGGKIESRNITVGLSNDSFYEVLKGLEEGEDVVVNVASSENSRFRNQGNRGGGSLIPGLPGGGRR